MATFRHDRKNQMPTEFGFMAHDHNNSYQHSSANTQNSPTLKTMYR